MSRVCQHCGTATNGTESFCGRCGAALPQVQQPYQQQPYQQPYQQQPYQQQPYQQQPYQQQPYQSQHSQAQPPQNELGMKWFKFLIYFSLFAGAILNAASGVQALNGLHYGSTEEAEFVYAFFPDLKNLDMFYGIALIVIAVFGLVIRFQLSGFKKNGPTMYYIMLAAAIVVPLIYMVSFSNIVGDFVSIDYSTNVASMCVSLAMLVCNITYFNKRKHLFVN